MNSAVTDFFRVGFTRIIVILSIVGSNVITARWLGPENVGIIASLTVYPTMLLTFGSLGVGQSATHFVGGGQFSEKSIQTAITQIWLFTSILSLIASILLIRYVSNVVTHWAWILLAVAPVPFSLFNQYQSGLFLGQNKITRFNLTTWLPRLTILLATAALVIAWSLRINGALIALAIGPFVMFMLLFVQSNFFKFFNLKIEWHVIRAMLSLGVIYAVALLFINLNYRLDIILLDRLSNATQTGLYAKGVSIAKVLWEVPALMGLIIFARSSAAKDGRDFSLKVAQLLRLSLIAVGLIAIVTGLAARPLVLILFGAQFEYSAVTVQILLPGVFLMTIFKVTNMDLAGKGKPWISLQAMVPAAIVNSVLNIVLIPAHGASGAAIASSVSYTIGTAIFVKGYCSATHIPVKTLFRYSKDDYRLLTGLVHPRRVGKQTNDHSSLH